jgi:hypothetical protein
MTILKYNVGFEWKVLERNKQYYCTENRREMTEFKEGQGCHKWFNSEQQGKLGILRILKIFVFVWIWHVSPSGYIKQCVLCLYLKILQKGRWGLED